MTAHTDKALRWSAIAGLIGALLLLFGDLLLYLHFDEMPAVAPAIEATIGPRKAILLATPTQLQVSTLLGPLAAACYIFGAWHVFARLRRGSTQWARITGVSFAASLICGGAYHALWGAFGLALQHANRQPERLMSLINQIAESMALLNSAVTIFALAPLLVLAAMVVIGRSDYPRWSVTLNPYLLYAIGTPLLTPLAGSVPAPYGALILGGLFNTVMIIFFAMSLFTLPRERLLRG